MLGKIDKRGERVGYYILCRHPNQIVWRGITQRFIPSVNMMRFWQSDGQITMFASILEAQEAIDNEIAAKKAYDKNTVPLDSEYKICSIRQFIPKDSVCLPQ